MSHIPTEPKLDNSQKQQQDEKPIPHNFEAEEAVIGALLVDRDAIAKVAAWLSPSDFFSEEIGHVYRAILWLYQENTPADIVTLRTALKRFELLGDGEGQVKAVNLFRWQSATPSAIHLEYYARLVKETSLRRKMIGVGAAITQLAFNQTKAPGDLLQESSELVQSLASWYTQQKADYFMSHEETYDIADFDLTAEEKQDAESGQTVRLRTGYGVLDGSPLTSPPAIIIRRSTLTVVLADTGVGKTIVGEQFGEANAKVGAYGLFFHNELDKKQMKARRYARLTGINANRIMDKELDGEEYSELIDAARRVKDWRGRVDFIHCPGWDANKVSQETKARHAMLLATKGKGLDFVVVDYLQRMGFGGNSRGQNMNELTTGNLQRLGDLANELGIAVILNSQVRREDDTKSFVKPTLHNALNCGNIERFSNQVIGIWRDEEKAELSILKSTFGQTGVVKHVAFIPGRYEFQ